MADGTKINDADMLTTRTVGELLTIRGSRRYRIIVARVNADRQSCEIPGICQRRVTGNFRKRIRKRHAVRCSDACTCRASDIHGIKVENWTCQDDRTHMLTVA